MENFYKMLPVTSPHLKDDLRRLLIFEIQLDGLVLLCVIRLYHLSDTATFQSNFLSVPQSVNTLRSSLFDKTCD